MREGLVGQCLGFTPWSNPSIDEMRAHQSHAFLLVTYNNSVVPSSVHITVGFGMVPRYHRADSDCI